MQCKVHTLKTHFRAINEEDQPKITNYNNSLGAPKGPQKTQLWKYPDRKKIKKERKIGEIRRKRRKREKENEENLNEEDLLPII